MAEAGKGIGDDLPAALYGLVRLAGSCVALPAAVIREVVPLPASLDPFPATRPDIIGAIDLRGQLIPVLDLAASLTGHGSSPGAGSIVVVVRHEESVCGILAEGIDGVRMLDAQAIGHLHITGEQGSLVKATFHHEGLRGILLDTAALASAPGLPLCEDRTARRDLRRTDHEPTLIFTLGGIRCALPAGCVDASLPWQDLPPAPIDDPLWIAMMPYKGMEIPALDTVALLGHGTMAQGRRGGAAIVLRTARYGAPAGEGRGRGLVALLIDSVDDIVRLGADAVTPLVAGVPGAAFARGLVPSAHGPCLLIDPERLITDPRLELLGTIEQNGAQGAGRFGTAPQGTAHGAPGAARPFLVFTLGPASFSVPLHVVEEILPADQELVPLPDDDTGMIGVFARRGQALPMIDLARCLGVPGDGEGGFVVVARFDREGETWRIGCRVAGLRSVERVVAQRIERGTSAPTLGMLAHTIRLEDGAACTVLDLEGIAHKLLAPAPLAA